MEIKELAISGCYEIIPPHFEDSRGLFVKTFHELLFSQAGIHFVMKEEFFSISHKNVLRGLHFQLPPSAHNKLLYCVAGEVKDFFVDLRKNSQTYGKNQLLTLSEKNRKMLYLPIGIAHGFYSLFDNTCIVYKVDHVYSC